jgi:transcriptional regulator with XRE-family HTH domain
MTHLGDRLELRRLELGLSRQALAEAVGCRASAIKGLEEGGDLGNWPFRLVANLRAALGMEWTDLQADADASALTSTNTQRIGAELARHGHVREVDLHASGLSSLHLQQLRAGLSAVGMTLAAHQNGAHHLAAEEHEPLESCLGHATNPLDNFDPAEHKLLADAIAGRLRLQSLNHPQTRLLGGLIKKGHLAKRDGALHISGPLRTALGLGPEPQPTESPAEAGRD